MAKPVTLAELAALLALAQDHALGQPPGSQLRAVAVSQHLAVEAGLDDAERATTWWTSALRFLGCTGHAFDMSVVFGDEIEMRARAARADFASPFDMLRLMVSEAGAEHAGIDRIRSVLSVLAGGKKAAEMNFRTACEVADMLAKRLGLDEPVLAALRTSFERWNGRGLPAGVKGGAIPLPMRVAQLGHEFEILARIEGVPQAVRIVRDRSGRAYDPHLARLVAAGGPGWWGELEHADPWDAALGVAPDCAPLDPDGVREALLVVADFADLKSPWISGHSRAVAELAGDACGPEAVAPALVHDLGRVAVPNTVWDKPGPLTRDERDRAEMHCLVTDQLLRRLPFTAELAGAATAAHERVDGSGYHRHMGAANLELVQRVIAAADCYDAMTSDRPHRRALPPGEAAVELRRMASAGELDGEAVERVLEAAGHRRLARPELPAGLTQRETEVLRLLALGLTTRQMAEQLVISPKTADHHIQHIYTKIGASTRGAAALFAVENGILPSDSPS
ncbi:MAG TPA: HD domain-containing phosphohydrolase [Acidimicrobiales bacterium]|nr:HD domain-containing phosphohydrolase [Acidimicrobiales bacterium]